MTAREALEIMPNQIQELYVKNYDSDTPVSIPVKDWIRMTQEYDSIDAIVRAADNDMTGAQANDLAVSLEPQVMTELFQVEGDGEGTQPPALPSDTETKEEINTTIAPNGDSVYRTRRLLDTTRNEEEKAVYDDVRNKISIAAEKADNISSDAIDILSEVQYRHTMNRAEATGRSPKEIAEEFTSVEEGFASPFIKGSVTTYTDPTKISETLLTLGTNADPATVIHELGHVWMHSMAKDYSTLAKIKFIDMSPAQRAYWNSMELAANFFKLENMGQLYSMDKEAYVAAQETFAQTTEEYFMDDAGFSTKIRSLMEAFRRFILPFANIVGKAYKQYPAIPMSKDVATMFEGIIGVTDTNDDLILPNMPEPVLNISILGNDAERYYQDVYDAQAAVASKFMSKIQARSYRERQKAIDSFYDAAYDQAKERVDQQEAIVIMDMMEDNYDTISKLRKENGKIPDNRISYKSFIALMGDEGLAANMRKSLSKIVAPAKKGGADAYEVMNSYGIEDVSEMKMALQTMANRSADTDRLATQIAEEQYPALVSDQEIETRALEAYADESYQKLRRQELKWMMENSGTSLKNLAQLLGQSPLKFSRKAYVNRRAQEMVGESKVQGFKVRTFRADAIKKADKAARLFKTDVTGALNTMIESLIAHKAYEISIQARNELIEVNKQIKIFKKSAVSTQALKNKVDADVMAYGILLIDGFQNGVGNLPTIPMPQGFPVDSSGAPLTGLTTDIAKNINAQVESYNELFKDGLGIDSQGNPKATVDQARQFNQLLKSIKKQARNAKKVTIGNKAMSTQEVSESFISEINLSDTKGEKYGAKNGITAGLRGLVATPRAVLESLYSTPEAFAESNIGKMYALIQTSEAKSRQRMNSFGDRLRKVVEARTDLTKEQRTRWENMYMPILSRAGVAANRPDSPSASNKPIEYVGENNFTFQNLSQVLTGILLMGSESGAIRLMRDTMGQPWDVETKNINRAEWDSFIQGLIDEGTLTKSDFDIVAEVWSIFAEIHPELSTAVRKSEGRYIGKIEGVKSKVKLKDGTEIELSGGYFPIADTEQTASAKSFDEIAGGNTFDIPMPSLYPTQYTGMTKERQLSASTPVDLDMNRALMYMSSALNYIYLREPTTDMYKILRTPEVRELLDSEGGLFEGSYDNVIAPWLASVAKQSRNLTEGIEVVNVIGRFLRKNVNIATYAGNLSSALLQITGIAPVVSKMGAATVSKGWRTYQMNRETINNLMAMDPKMAEIQMSDQIGFDRSAEWEDLDFMGDWISKSRRNTEKFAYFFIQKGQAYTNGIVWTSQFLKSVQRIKGEKVKGGKDLTSGLTNEQLKQAMIEAREMVVRTQGSSMISDLNRLQKSNEGLRLIAGIGMSYFFTTNNMLRTTRLRNGAVSKEVVGLMTALAAGGAVSFAIREAVNAAGRGLVGREDDREEDEILQSMAAEVGSGVIGTFAPVVGNTAVSLAQGYDAQTMPAVGIAIKTLSASASTLKSIATGVPVSDYQLNKVFNAITIATRGGIPLSALGKLGVTEPVLNLWYGRDKRSRDRMRRRASRR